MDRSVIQAAGILAVGMLVVGNVAWAQGGADLISKGEQVYADKKCAMCHSIRGKGGKSGGDLSDVGSKRDVAWLTQFTKSPKSVMPNAKMPSFRGSEEDLVAVAAYMASLK